MTPSIEPMDTIECLVVGAGVIGLAIARSLALDGREVMVVEAAEAIGTQTSSRNSEVIHAGIYYPSGSLMARTCVAGREMLYGFCAAHGVPYRRCGKLIVATNEAEAGRLRLIELRARANGVLDLEVLSAREVSAEEPELHCSGALLSPSTGIVDSHAFMLALQGDLEAAGGLVALRAPMLGAAPSRGGLDVHIGGDEPTGLHCRLLINAAGLQAPGVAGTILGLVPEFIPRPYYCRGVYFTLAGRAPFRRLIYPVPVPGGLGVHLTLDLANQARFGPDVEWIDAIDYTVDPARANGFYDAIRRYWPGLPNGALQPGYAGVRPKVVPAAVATQDFIVQGPQQHGVAGLINLFGIESPGLTAALALADLVLSLAAPSALRVH